MVPLPPQAELLAAEVVAYCEGLALLTLYRLLHDFRNFSVLVAEHRPSVDPCTWHEHRDTADSSSVLEYESIPVALRIVEDGSLGYSVCEASERSLEDHLLLVWTLDLVSSVAYLPADASAWP